MIPTTARRSPVYTGTGAVFVYPFGFKVFQDSDVQVVVTSTLGVESTLVYGADYSVTRNADQDTTPGGTINLVAALGLSAKLVVVGATDYSQTTQLPTGGNYNATIVERALDRLAMQSQQLLELGTRTLRLPSSEVGPLVLPALASRASAFLACDASGNVIAATGVASAVVSVAMAPVVQGATLALARTAMGAATSGDVAASGLTTPTATILGRATAGTGAIEELSAASARTVMGAADDTAVVKLTGNQTVAGNKTFSGTTALAAVTATDVTTTGNTILGDASTDTLNVGNGGIVKDSSGNVQFSGAQLNSAKVSITASSEMLSMRSSGAAGGKSWRQIVDSSNSFQIINNGGSGVFMSDGATSWSAASDERLKDIIEPIGGALDKVDGLRTVIGKYKTDGDGVRRAFLIAQDVQVVLPEAVSEQDGFLSVRYSELVPLLAAAVKELHQLVRAQGEQIATLTAARGAE